MFTFSLPLPLHLQLFLQFILLTYVVFGYLLRYVYTTLRLQLVVPTTFTFVLLVDLFTCTTIQFYPSLHLFTLFTIYTPFICICLRYLICWILLHTRVQFTLYVVYLYSLFGLPFTFTVYLLHFTHVVVVALLPSLLLLPLPTFTVFIRLVCYCCPLLYPQLYVRYPVQFCCPTHVTVSLVTFVYVGSVLRVTLFRCCYVYTLRLPLPFVVVALPTPPLPLPLRFGYYVVVLLHVTVTPLPAVIC